MDSSPSGDQGSQESSVSFLGQFDESAPSAADINNFIGLTNDQTAQAGESAINAAEPSGNDLNLDYLNRCLGVGADIGDLAGIFDPATGPTGDEPSDNTISQVDAPAPNHEEPASTSPTPQGVAQEGPLTSASGQFGQPTPLASSAGQHEHQVTGAPIESLGPAAESKGSPQAGDNAERKQDDQVEDHANPGAPIQNQGLDDRNQGQEHLNPGSHEDNAELGVPNAGPSLANASLGVTNLGVTNKAPGPRRRRCKFTKADRERVLAEVNAASDPHPPPAKPTGGRKRKSPGSPSLPSGADPVNARSGNTQERLSDFEGEEDEEAKRFEQLELEYLRKREAKTDTEADRLWYLNARRKEQRRLASMRDSKSERPRPATAQERQPRSGSEPLFVSNDEEESSEGETFDMTPAAKRARKQSQKQAERSRIKRGLAIGLEAQRAKVEKKKRGRKGQPATDKPAKGKRKNESKKDAAAKRSKKRKQAVNEAVNSGNVYSTTRDVGADANQNLGHDVARFTDKKKKEAFAELVASTPLENRNTVVMDKRNLYHAMSILGRNRCRLSGDGLGFSLTGTTLSLRPYQVLGAAFLKERENGPDAPFGGVCADELGLGKTIQMLACMVSNPPERDSLRRTDLIVASPALLAQWEDEFLEHLKKRPAMMRYQGNSKVRGPGLELIFERCDIVMTSYEEVRESFPKFTPPPDKVSELDQWTWYRDTFLERAGPIHKLSWRRLICDEAHAMKNRESQTFKAMKAIDASIRWAITGTPATNTPEEFFPYLSWLQVPHSGTFETFKKNFIDAKGGLANERLRTFLKTCLMRRVHADTLLGRPLLRLPEFRSYVVYVDFDDTQRYLYELIRKRYAEKINAFHREGILERRKRNVLTYLLRLRQMCCHFFLCEQDIRELVEGEDIEALWTKMKKPLDMLINMRKAFAQKKDFTTGEVVPEEEQPSEDTADNSTMTLEFREVLKDLAKPEQKNAIFKRTLCGKCSDLPQDPWFTDCCHIYCHDCLDSLAIEAAADGEDAAKCLVCGTQYRESKPCEGIKEFSELADSREPSPVRRGRSRSSKEESEVGWMSIKGKILPSAKLAGFAFQVRKWMAQQKNCKILVFTQWTMAIKILSRYCTEQQWG